MIRLATALASSSTGPTANQVSPIPSSPAIVSASGTPASVSSRIKARTRSGAVSATRKREKPALAHPADDGALDAEVVEQRRGSRLAESQ